MQLLCLLTPELLLEIVRDGTSIPMLKLFRVLQLFCEFSAFYRWLVELVDDKNGNLKPFALCEPKARLVLTCCV